MNYKNKTLIVAFLLIIMIVGGIGCYQLYEQREVLIYANRYAVWSSFLDSRLGSISMMLLPVLIAIGTTSFFHEQYHSGILKDIVLRKGYSKTCLNVMGHCYKKCLLLMPLFLLILFCIISFSLPTESIEGGGGNLVSGIPWDNFYSPFMHVMIVIVINFFYGIFITNLALFASRYTKKFYLVLLYTFLLMNLFNFGVSFVISPMLGGMLQVSLGNVFSIMMPNSIALAELTLGICLIISGLMCYFAYRNKERVLL